MKVDSYYTKWFGEGVLNGTLKVYERGITWYLKGIFKVYKWYIKAYIFMVSKMVY